MQAMILAAGRGERMAPLTDTCPKPLLEVAGKALIEHQIERLRAAGVVRIVINHAWLGEQIMERLGDGGRLGVSLSYSAEPAGALDSGGGIQAALPLLGDAPFLVTNADLWTDFPFRELVEAGLADDDLARLVLVPNPPQHPHGDFGLCGTRALDQADVRHTFAGIGVYRPALFAGQHGGRYSVVPLLRAAMRAGRVAARLYHGDWHDIGTPARLAALDARLRGLA